MERRIVGGESPNRPRWCVLGREAHHHPAQAVHEPFKIRRRLADFYDAAIDAQLPEATRLAEIYIHQYRAPNRDMTGLLSSGSPEVGNTGSRIRRCSCGKLVAFYTSACERILHRGLR